MKTQDVPPVNQILAILVNNWLTLLFVVLVACSTAFVGLVASEMTNPLLTMSVVGLFLVSAVSLLFRLARRDENPDLLSRDVSHVLTVGSAMALAAVAYASSGHAWIVIIVFLSMIVAWLYPRGAYYRVSIRRDALPKAVAIVAIGIVSSILVLITNQEPGNLVAVLACSIGIREILEFRRKKDFSSLEVFEFLFDVAPVVIIMLEFSKHNGLPVAAIIGGVIYLAMWFSPREYGPNGWVRFL